MRSSAGDEAVELARSAGLILDDWQQWVLRESLRERADGQWSAFEACLIVPRQNGKGDLGLDTPILTTEGWRTMGTVSVGDYVYGADGTPTRVVATSDVFTDHVCYRVRFTDGAEYVAGADHLWHVYDVQRERWLNVTTSELSQKFGKRRANGRMEYRFRVRCDAIPQTSEANLPIDPYLFGYWLGDGTSGSATITTGHLDLPWVEHIISRSGARVGKIREHDHGNALSVRFRLDAKMRDGFESRCRRLGVWNNKHIPDVYLSASPEQRWALLRGLMDSDGCANKQRCATQAEFSSSYPAIADGFLRLTRSLGIRVTERRSKTAGRDRSRFMWTPTTNPFEMPRKASRVEFGRSGRDRNMSVTDVSLVPTIPTRCIQVARPDGVYLVGHLFTPTHNSVLEALELAAMVLFGEQLIVHSAHKFDTAQEHFLRMQALVETCDDLRRCVAKISTSNGKEAIHLLSGARLKFVARSRGAARGFSGDRIVLDEAFNLPAEVVGSMLPALSARDNPQVWYTSSAPHYDSHVLHGLRRRGVSADPGRLFYAEWGCEPGVDLDDRDSWYAANPALGIRISEEFVENELAALRALGDEFARERLGVASDEDAGHGVFGPGGWPGCADPKSRRDGPPTFSFDVGPDQAWASIGVAARRADGLVHVEVVECRPGSGWLVERLQKIQQGFGQAAWFDPRGPAAGLVPDLETAGVRVEPLPGGEFSDACAAFQRGVLEGQVRHLDQRSLNDAVAVAARRQVGDAWVWARARSDADITALVSVTAAYWAHVQADTTVDLVGQVW